MPIVLNPQLYNSGSRSISASDLVTLGTWVTVSSVGFATGSAQWNGGADYGPDTPGTTTSGIAEALASAYSVVLLQDTGTYTTRSTIALPSNKLLVGPSYGGLGYAAAVSLPTTTINYTGSTGDAITVSGNTTVSAAMVGIAVTASTSGSVVHFGGGQRSCFLQDVYLKNASSAANSFALRLDTALANFNSENNHFVRVTAQGGYAGLGIGYQNQSQKANNSDFYSLTTSGGTYGVVHVDGGHMEFFNYYDRSSPSTAVYLIQAGSADFYGSEFQGGASGSNLILMTNGFVTLNSVSLTPASGQTTLNVQGGTLKVGDGCQANGAQTFSLTSGGKILFDRMVINAGSDITVTGSGATLYLPTVATSGSPTVTGFTGTVTNY